MVKTRQYTPKQRLDKLLSLAPLLAVLSLTGCYIEVTPSSDIGYDAGTDFPSGITQFTTQLLVDTAITPLMLSTESAAMLKDPDVYTSPRVRTATRAVTTITTYSYLFDNWDCDYGGNTQLQAEADTTTHDGYIDVDMTLNSRADHCQVRQDGKIHQIDSDLHYDVTGVYDRWEDKISTIDAALTGNVSVEYGGRWFEHNYIDLQVTNQSSTDLVINGSSRIKLNDGYYNGSARLLTSNSVHVFFGESHPHYGTVRLNDGSDWVTLSFETDGVWRTDSNGYDHFASWSTLGY